MYKIKNFIGRDAIYGVQIQLCKLRTKLYVNLNFSLKSKQFKQKSVTNIIENKFYYILK